MFPSSVVGFMLFMPLFWGTLIFALARGGPSERAVILVLAAAFTATPLLVRNFNHPFIGFEAGVLAVSCVSFLLLLAVALRSEKFWPLWITAIQGQVVISHIAGLFPQVNPWTYQMANSIWAFVQLILVATATWEHRRWWVAKPVGTNFKP